jgi:hypothetical protein
VDGFHGTGAEKQELFTFGAVRDLNAEELTRAVLLARYRAYPDWGHEGPPRQPGDG